MKDLMDRASKLILKIEDAKKWLKVDQNIKKIKELEVKMSQKNFWTNQTLATSVSKEAADLSEEVKTWEEIDKGTHEVISLLEEAQKENDSSIEIYIRKKIDDLESKFNKLEFNLMFNEPYDRDGAIISIHAGAGGTDAQDWASMLERMYLRYAENKDFKVKIIDRQVGSEAGIKSVVLEVIGKQAYGWFKSEAGVHRLVRISPYDAEKMRHTSFALIEVLPDLGELTEIELKDEDLEITTAKASGPGGQGVNTTDSAVRVKHKPTGIMVSCKNERSQLQNKETALKILKSKLKKYNEAEQEEERKRLKGEFSEAAWGNQIRSYILHPYKMVKDHRSNFESQEVNKILDGELDKVIISYLKLNKEK